MTIPSGLARLADLPSLALQRPIVCRPARSGCAAPSHSKTPFRPSGSVTSALKTARSRADEPHLDVAERVRDATFGALQRTEMRRDPHRAEARRVRPHAEHGREQAVVRMRRPGMRVGARRLGVLGRRGEPHRQHLLPRLEPLDVAVGEARPSAAPRGRRSCSSTSPGRASHRARTRLHERALLGGGTASTSTAMRVRLLAVRPSVSGASRKSPRPASHAFARAAARQRVGERAIARRLRGQAQSVLELGRALERVGELQRDHRRVAVLPAGRHAGRPLAAPSRRSSTTASGPSRPVASDAALVPGEHAADPGQEARGRTRGRRGASSSRAPWRPRCSEKVGMYWPSAEG